MAVDIDSGETQRLAMVSQRLGLLWDPSVAGMSGRIDARDLSFQNDESSTGYKHPTRFSQCCVDVSPVVRRRKRPHNVSAAIGKRDRLCSAGLPLDLATKPTQLRYAQHHGSWVHADHFGPEATRRYSGDAGTTTDVDDPKARCDSCEFDDCVRSASSSREKRHGSHKPAHARETGMVVVVICNHAR
jgi:hypothetical protein